IAPYRLARIFSFFHPEADPLGISYQLKQALIAIGSGKIFGIEKGFGLGVSRQKFGFLPHSMSDSIFAIIGEEMGFIGCTILIVFFLVLAWRGLRIAYTSEKSFFQLLALGITVWIMLQTFFNIGGMIGILPLAGIPLPFFSYGGSHLIAEMIGVGILLNISKKL
ncbi:FtsW/RodA/SpoVE family cell cycle protein, partial [Patescibacteria group bacterium]|nr:FtsW/RodA/SpoVE family cell cycle protein [Patescibacteria group bacterium]